MTTYKVTLAGRRMFCFDMDCRNASAPIFLEGGPTPFQTASVSHNPFVAAAAINDWMESQGGGYFDPEADFHVEEVESDE